MSKKIIGIILIAILFSTGCQKEIEDYFNKDTDVLVNSDLLTVLRQESEYSEFVRLLDEYQIDTLFDKGLSYTIFVPTNDAIAQMEPLYLDTLSWLGYLITESFINLNQVDGQKKIQTLNGKFAVVDNVNNQFFVDGVEINSAGPLCNNGRYYEIGQVIQPKPNLYEYITLTNPFFSNYIALQDSAYLDLELSTPIGYDNQGNTVYDSVIEVVNTFELEYFPISEEFRTKAATMLLFTQEQYDEALQLIVDDLSLASVDQIPVQWQNDVLMPYLINQGVFWNRMELNDFAEGRIRNIQGDSVDVSIENIDVNSEFDCSNGKAFNYLNFTIPDSVYKGRNIIQGEHLIYSRGSNLYAWDKTVMTTGTPVEPLAQELVNIADNDSLLYVKFKEQNYSNEFSLSFKFKNVFPGTYRFLWRGKYTPSGVFQIYCNGELQKINLGREETDRVDLYDLRNPVRSVTKEVFRAENGFNSFDVLIKNITEYGDVEIKIVYIGPGQKSDNGFVVDYFMLEGIDVD